MKILKKSILLLLAMIIIIYSLIPLKVVKADVYCTYTPEQHQEIEKVGKAIASVAEDFYDKYHEETIYDCGKSGGYYNPYIGKNVEEYWGRIQAYQGFKTSGIAYGLNGTGYDYQNKYAIDCVGLVSLVIHCATGLGGETFGHFGHPTNYAIRWSGRCSTF